MQQRSYKIAAIFLVFCGAFWLFSIAIHDWIDAKLNLEFMRFVLSGSDKAASSLRITDLMIIQWLFYIIVIFESIICLFFVTAFISMLKNINNESKFRCSKEIAVYGIILCLFKYFILFICVAAEWFYMYQTAPLAQMKAGIFTALMVVMLIYLKIID